MKRKSTATLPALLVAGTLLLTGPVRAHAFSYGDFFLNPSVSVGYNSEQGTVVRFGVDAGMHVGDYLHAGVSGFYGAGNHPAHDREIGAGPFVGLAYPVFDFLIGEPRYRALFVRLRLPPPAIPRIVQR